MFQNDIAELSVSDRIATVNKRLQSTTSKTHNDRFSKTVMSDEDLICFMNPVRTLLVFAHFSGWFRNRRLSSHGSLGPAVPCPWDI